MAGFYEDRPERCLRLGDVITGFQLATAQIHRPSEERANWAISVDRPSHLAIMTPCCSIENKSIVLTPLLSIRPAFLKNPYFEEDLTRINREVPPEKSVAPEVWESQEFSKRKEKMLAIGLVYAFDDCFIYAQHDLLPQYELHCKPPRKTGYYMVDFKRVHRIDCELIERERDPPPGMKTLQLSVQTRAELRDKLAWYFGRVPEEDALLL